MPEDLDIFCAIVSSGNRLQMIEAMAKELRIVTHPINKGFKKLMTKEDQAACDKLNIIDGGEDYELVQRNIFGEQIRKWIPAGKRAQFIKEQK